jgi:hypothetical protein
MPKSTRYNNLGTLTFNVTTVAAATYDVLPTDVVILVDYTTTGAVAIDLKTAQMLEGRTIFIHDCDGNASVNNITVTTEGAELINGGASVALATDNGGLIITSDGTGWWAH